MRLSRLSLLGIGGLPTAMRRVDRAVAGASRATCLAPCAARTQHVDQQRNDHLGAADAKEAAENADAKPGDDVRRQRYTPRMPYRAKRVSVSNGGSQFLRAKSAYTASSLASSV